MYNRVPWDIFQENRNRVYDTEIFFLFLFILLKNFEGSEPNKKHCIYIYIYNNIAKFPMKSLSTYITCTIRIRIFIIPINGPTIGANKLHTLIIVIGGNYTYTGYLVYIKKYIYIYINTMFLGPIDWNNKYSYSYGTCNISTEWLHWKFSYVISMMWCHTSIVHNTK
jgi:hypothetical protein